MVLNGFGYFWVGMAKLMAGITVRNGKDPKQNGLDFYYFGDGFEWAWVMIRWSY